MPSYPSVGQPSTAAPAYDAPQTTPVVATPVVVGQPVATSDPTYAQMVQDTTDKPEGTGEPQHVQPQTVQPQLGGAHVINVPAVVVYDPRHEDDRSCMLGCAQVSCMLSVFFPIVGCIAFCANLDAKEGSERYKWARRCLLVAIVMIALAILWRVIVYMTLS
ncbi:unnamed protein product [Vitrella brassicaformis CCMP3155]|uniref:Uncharacterized protein n=1 Tax=Vitrella brassicaformis (strain CCMP3155) TaxID=1169540 RepID=A0A0G4EGL6_VITBC|nr:unnamed protein product [Vitrella brassicaformis CCMP3155]|eukprot:CEL95583.1 unnamed protein product [Vitrella brassicaformis CCMP3155]